MGTRRLRLGNHGAGHPAAVQPEDGNTPNGLCKARGEAQGVIARHPNHVRSVDRTRVWRWGLWPTWALVAVDRSSRAVTAVAPLEAPNAGWIIEV